MRFEHPQILWLLPVLPVALAVFFWWALHSRQRLLSQFIEARLLAQLTVGISPARKKMRFAFLILAVVFLISALARPQHGFDLEEVEQRGLDIVVAIDTSKSMLTTDIAPNRLERAKLAALELMQDAKSDRLGLVAFAGESFLECPLTIDNTAFQQSVQALDVNSIPEGGTALAAAINTALTAFKEKDHYKVLVLLTDGEDNDSETGALVAAQNAAKEGLKIFTIGIGTAAGDLIRITDANGNSDYVRDEQGNVVKSHLNEALLRQIAGATGGFYLPLRANTIDTLYAKGLAPLPKTEAKEKLIRRYHEQFHWPLAAAILLLLAEMFLPERKRRKKNAATVSKIGTATMTQIAVVVALCVLPGAAFGSASSALREFNAGRYEQALGDYQKLLQKGTGDPRLNFDAGAAAYRDQKFGDAATNFNAVISAPDLKLQESGYYNLGNALYRLGEQNQDLDGKKQSWENALTNYSNTLKLNPQDEDAKFNYDFVKKKLDELKKQQQQQQQKNNQQQNPQQQNQQSQQQQAQNSQSQQKQQSQNSSSQQNQSQQQEQQNSQQNQSQQNSQEKQNQPAQSQSNQQNNQPQDQSDSSQSQEKSGKSGNNEQANAMQTQGMTPQEAKQLLDAQKGDEQFLTLKPKDKPENQNRPVKDW
jgi:Ca-activated chloride channel family protein